MACTLIFFFLGGLAYEINASANCLKHLSRLYIQQSFVKRKLFEVGWLSDGCFRTQQG